MIDILGKYEQKQSSESPRQFHWQPSAEHRLLIRLVMWLSGGRIREANEANRILLVISVTILLISSLIWIWLMQRPKSSPPPWPTPDFILRET